MGKEDFEMYVISRGLKLDDIDENIINDYCSSLFYTIETEEDLEDLNNTETELRTLYLKEVE